MTSVLAFQSDAQSAEEKSSKQLRQMKDESTGAIRNRVGVGIARTTDLEGCDFVNGIR